MESVEVNQDAATTLVTSNYLVAVHLGAAHVLRSFCWTSHRGQRDERSNGCSRAKMGHTRLEGMDDGGGSLLRDCYPVLVSGGHSKLDLGTGRAPLVKDGSKRPLTMH